MEDGKGVKLTEGHGLKLARIGEIRPVRRLVRRRPGEGGRPCEGGGSKPSRHGSTARRETSASSVEPSRYLVLE